MTIVKGTDVFGGGGDDIVLVTGGVINSGGTGDDWLVADGGATIVDNSGGSLFGLVDLDDPSAWSTHDNALFGNAGIPHTTVAITGATNQMCFYAITVGAGETLTIDIDSRGGIDPIVDLLDGSQTLLAHSDDAVVSGGGEGEGQNLDPYISWTNTTDTPMVVLIRVSEFGDSNGNFEGDENLLLNVSLTGHATGAPSASDAVMHGNDGADVLLGSGGNDALYGDADNDTLYGGAGDDALHGGDGDDSMYWDGGADSFDGGTGTDIVTIDMSAASAGRSVRWTGDAQAAGSIEFLAPVVLGGAYADAINLSGAFTLIGGAALSINAGEGNDTITCDVAGSQVMGEGGLDTLYLDGGAVGRGGDGNDWVQTYGSGDIYGDAGNDSLFVLSGTGAAISGGIGDDHMVSHGYGRMWGGEGNDTLTGGGELYGQEGDDTLSMRNDGAYYSHTSVMDGGVGDDTVTMTDTGYIFVHVNGGDGDDTVSFQGMYLDIGFSLAETDNQSLGSTIYRATGFENVIGGSANDRLSGDAKDNVISGADGDDVLYGGGGGSDQLFGGQGQDRLMVGANTQTIDGGSGSDVASFEMATNGVDVSLAIAGAQSTGWGSETLAGIENLTGSWYADRLTGDAASNVLNGNAGNDTLDGGAGDDRLIGEAGADVLIGGAGSDVLVGGTGDDFLIGGSGLDRVEYCGSTALSIDLMITDAQFISDAEGSDTLVSIEIISTGTGADTVFGSNANNTIYSDAGDDFVTGRGGNDVLWGQSGNDRMYGGTGNDVLVGESGNDRLWGSAGDDEIVGGIGLDTLCGGAGRDVITGGSQADTFLFSALSESATSAALADRIVDFSHAAGDRIVLSAIDAIAGGANNRFTFIGDAAFSAHAGQLRYAHVAGDTLVEMDVNGDGVSDMSIVLTGSLDLVAADFVL